MTEDNNIYQENTKYSIQYILDQIEKIGNNTEYLQQAINAIATMPVNESPNGGFADQGKGHAIGQIVESREETNKKLITFYEKIYTDLQGSTSYNSVPSAKDMAIRAVAEKISDIDINTEDADGVSQIIESLNATLDTLRHIFSD